MSAARWNAMTVAERRALIKKDPSMRRREWAQLLARWASTSYEAMSPAMRDGTDYLLSKFGAAS